MVNNCALRRLQVKVWRRVWLMGINMSDYYAGGYAGNDSPHVTNLQLAFVF